MRFAASRASRSDAESRSSGRIDHAARRQDVVTPERIPNELLLDEIHPPSEKSLELFAHRLPSASPRTEIRLRLLECDQHVDIAVGVEFIGQNGPKKCKLFDP